MRNDIKTKIGRIMSLVEKLPYFNLNSLLPIEEDKNYLKILLSRQEKSGKIIRLKKGVYVTERYILEHLNRAEMSTYYEFLANILYSPSYLSLEYILHENNILTDIPVNFTSISKNKTMHFSNKFGEFFYHKIKDELFLGYETIKNGNFIIYKATMAKALFDYLYLRKNLLIDRKTIDELRLNLDELTAGNKKELKKYTNLEGSKKMKKIFESLFNNYSWNESEIILDEKCEA